LRENGAETAEEQLALPPELLAGPGPPPHIAADITVTHDHEQGHVAQSDMLNLLVPADLVEKLWVRADNAQKDVLEHISTLDIAQKMLDYIQTARNEMLGGSANYEDAERYVNEVEYRVALSKKLKYLSRVYVAWLYAYEIVWAIVLLSILIFYLGSAAFDSATMEGTTKITYLTGSMVWGGFGGVIGALLSLIKHISIDQDFDKQHTWWYIHSPASGICIGAVVYIFMQLGVTSIIGSQGEISSPIAIYALAWLSGYQHNVFTDLVKRMLKTLMGEDKKEEAKSTDTVSLNTETK